MTVRGLFRISAIALGVFLALWFLRGDTEATQTFSAIVQVQKEESVSFNDVKVFNVTFQNGTKITIMGSSLAPLISFLGTTTKQVVLEVRPRDLEKIER